MKLAISIVTDNISLYLNFDEILKGGDEDNNVENENDQNENNDSPVQSLSEEVILVENPESYEDNAYITSNAKSTDSPSSGMMPPEILDNEFNVSLDELNTYNVMDCLNDGGGQKHISDDEIMTHDYCDDQTLEEASVPREPSNQIEDESKSDISGTKGSKKCSACHKVFTSTKDYNIHKDTEHKDLKCDICNVQCQNIHHLGCHLKKHSHVMDYKCEVCGREFVYESSYKVGQISI